MLEKEKISRIGELHGKGLKQKDIASQLSISTVTVRKYLKLAQNEKRHLHPESSRLIASFRVNTMAHYPEAHFGKLGSLLQGCAMRNLPSRLYDLFNFQTASTILGHIHALGIKRGHFVVNLYQNDGTPNVMVKAYPDPSEANIVAL